MKKLEETGTRSSQKFGWAWSSLYYLNATKVVTVCCFRYGNLNCLLQNAHISVCILQNECVVPESPKKKTELVLFPMAEVCPWQPPHSFNPRGAELPSRICGAGGG